MSPSTPRSAAASEPQAEKSCPAWGCLIHLGMNMWFDRPEGTFGRSAFEQVNYRPYLRFDTTLWDDMLPAMARAGVKMVVLDLAEGVRYDSHPELGARGAWTPARLKRELARIRALGMEPAPKLNFSASHDQWLGPYARCVSTDAYYAVCRDLIEEVSALFGGTGLFHLGMDEESFQSQALYEYAVVRQHDLWWRDFYLLAGEVEKRGRRPWIWSDFLWRHEDEFVRRMPKTVVQSNWHYRADFGGRFASRPRGVQAYDVLEAHGYDQIPAASNCYETDNARRMVDYCRKRIAPRRLHGFLMTVWKPFVEAYRRRWQEAVDLAGLEEARCEGRKHEVIERPGAVIRAPDRPGIRVGVYEAGLGCEALAAGLNACKGMNAFVLPRLDKGALSLCDVLIVPQARERLYLLRAASTIRTWVAAGGGALFLHDAVGYRGHPAIFPEIGAAARVSKADVVVAGGHAISGARGPGEVVRGGFEDHVVVRKGRKAQVVLKEKAGPAVVVAGAVGLGRVALNGMAPGWVSAVGQGGEARAPEGDELRLLAGTVRWLAGEKRALVPRRAR